MLLVDVSVMIGTLTYVIGSCEHHDRNSYIRYRFM